MKTDIEIANSVTLMPICKIARKLGISEEELELYGNYKAKISKTPSPKSDNLVLVTAINPTAFGEGKTTTSIGLADGMSKLGKKVCLALREPSLGPVFGIKGGATGGGMAQIAPMQDINLHFTGDMHAITTANNLISAILDNHIMQGNELNIDIDNVIWKRCMDMNDRALRYIEVGKGGPKDGVERKDGFNITAASEIMAILCLAKDMADLKERIGNIIVAYSKDGRAVTARDLEVVDSVAIVLKDALKPNLVQTLEGTPAIVHGGPFANIAHGCNTVIATKLAMSVADYVVTEAGFGADLGAEKFLDIKCRVAGIRPKAVVLVATVRALKYNGGIKKEDVAKEDLQALEKGLPNLVGHIRNLRDVYGVNVVVAVNKFLTDTDSEIRMIEDACKSEGAVCALCECWAKGGDGSIELAKAVIKELEKPSKLQFAYDLDMSVEDKINAVATKVYGAAGVEYTDAAKASLAKIKELGKDKLPVCIAKTQYSFSDDMKLLGRPTGFTMTVRDIEIRGGAGFLVVVCGSIMLMPGLGKRPSALNMTIDSQSGEIKGLF